MIKKKPRLELCAQQYVAFCVGGASKRPTPVMKSDLEVVDHRCGRCGRPVSTRPFWRRGSARRGAGLLVRGLGPPLGGFGLLLVRVAKLLLRTLTHTGFRHECLQTILVQFCHDRTLLVSLDRGLR